MPARTSTNHTEWVSGCEAKRLGNLTWYRLQKNVVLGKVRALVEPGCAIRYHKQDVERLRKESALQPAGA